MKTTIIISLTGLYTAVALALAIRDLRPTTRPAMQQVTISDFLLLDLMSKILSEMCQKNIDQFNWNFKPHSYKKGCCCCFCFYKQGILHFSPLPPSPFTVQGIMPTSSLLYRIAPRHALWCSHPSLIAETRICAFDSTTTPTGRTSARCPSMSTWRTYTTTLHRSRSPATRGTSGSQPTSIYRLVSPASMITG